MPTGHYNFDDFVSPHHEGVFNAHIYPVERDDGHCLPNSRTTGWIG